MEITGRLDFEYTDLFGESVTNVDGNVSADTVLTASAGGVSAADSLSLYVSAEQMARLNAVQVAFKISEDEKVHLSAGSYFALSPEITSDGYDGRYEDNNETEIPAQGVKWMYFTADDSIAKVDQNGRIEGVSEGTTTVTALLVPADSVFDGTGYVSDYPTLPKEAIRTYSFEVEVTKAQGSSTGSGTSVPTKPEPTTPPEPVNPPESGFTDVEQSAWYSSAVEYVFDNGIMVGLSDTEFAPDADITRAMFATIVYRISGEQATASSCQFDDVADGMWYTEAIAWCAEKGIVLGVSDTEYDPDGVITREQMCAMLKRYIDYTGAEYERVNDRVTFTDADSISAYAAEAVDEMAGYGIIHGRDTGEFDPKSGTTRAECATVVMNFMNLPDAPNEPDASNAL